MKTHMVTVQSIIHVQQAHQVADGLKPSCSLKGPTDVRSSVSGTQPELHRLLARKLFHMQTCARG